MTSIVEVIQHYQRSIDSSQDNEARLLHCINKLYKLPIKVEHLQETGVGKTVNSLRKFNGEIGVAAKTLVTKWKAMVTAEEEPMDTSVPNNGSPHNDGNGDSGTTPHDDEDNENQKGNGTNEQHKHSDGRSENEKEKHKDRHMKGSSSSGHKDSSSSSSHHHSSEKTSTHSNVKYKSSLSSSSSKDKEMEHKNSSHSGSKSGEDKEKNKKKTEHKSNRDKHKDRDHDNEKERNYKKIREEKPNVDKERKIESPPVTFSLHHTNSSSSKSKPEEGPGNFSKRKEHSEKHKSSSKDKERTKDEKSSSSHSSSKDKSERKSSSTSTSKSTTKDSERAEHKRRHNSDDIDFKPPQPKMAKIQKSSVSAPASKSESSPLQEESVEESFDSSMGANFDDILGMLNMPMKKSKKSSKSPTTPSNNSSSSNKKDTTFNKSANGGDNNSAVNKLNVTRTSNNPDCSVSFSTPSTSKASTVKPDLLAPTAKLEPLDPSIALELPTITTNYKPMPLNQTVMDCVFNTSASVSKPMRTLSDAETIAHSISSKTMRTKVYSGIKTGQTYQIPTLFDMCIRILQKNIDALEYTGGVPFDVLKPVLERATPQQLYAFEEYNPYLMEDSDVLWQTHVSRSYRSKKRLENESWREMFIRCQEEEERRLSVLKDSIKASQKIAAAPVRKTQLAFIDSMVKPPRNILRKQEQYGTKMKVVATPAARVASLSNVIPNVAKSGDQRLKVSTTARDHAQVSRPSVRTKKAPLMQKTLQFIRGFHKR